MPHPSQYVLERFFSGEITDDSIAAHVKGCAECSIVLEKLKTEQLDLLNEVPPSVFMHKIQSEQRINKKDRRFSLSPVWIWSACAAVVLIGLAAYFIPNLTNNDNSNKKPPELRWMGSNISIDVYINRNNRVFKSHESNFMPGDSLQYKLVAPPNQQYHTALIALENGKLSPVFPADPAEPSLPVHGVFDFGGSVFVEQSTGDLSLFVIVRAEHFNSQSVLKEMQDELDKTGKIEQTRGLVDIRTIERPR